MKIAKNINFGSCNNFKKTIFFFQCGCLFIKNGRLPKLVDNPPIVLIAPFWIVLQHLNFIEI